MKRISLVLILFVFFGCTKKSINSDDRVPASSELGGANQASPTEEGVGGENFVPPFGTRIAPKCNQFITNEGNIGPTGRKLIAAMKRVEEDKGKKCFFGDSSEASNLGKHCKGEDHFNSLSPEEKEKLWVWFWTALAHTESACRVNARHATPPVIYEGKVVQEAKVFDGIYQLPFRSVDRYLENKVYCPDRVDTQNLDFQVNCAVSRFADIHCGTDPIVSYVNRDKRQQRQWQPLNPKKSISGRFKALFKIHPLCN